MKHLLHRSEIYERVIPFWIHAFPIIPRPKVPRQLQIGQSFGHGANLPEEGVRPAQCSLAYFLHEQPVLQTWPPITNYFFSNRKPCGDNGRFTAGTANGYGTTFGPPIIQ